MNARSHFSEAQKNIFRNRAVIGYLYLINLLLAIAMTLPMVSNIEALASTAFAKDLIDGFFWIIFLITGRFIHQPLQPPCAFLSALPRCTSSSMSF